MLTISNSEVQKYKECRRSWYVQYYLGYQPAAPSVTGATNLGTKIHAALEAYYNPELDIDRQQSVRLLRAMYLLDISAHPESNDELEIEWELAHAMLTGYFDWLGETGADQGLEVYAVEREIIVPLNKDTNLRGRLDMIMHDLHSDALLFLDHKTCMQWLTPDYLERDEQAKFYMMLQRLDPNGDKALWCDGGIFNMLRKSKRTAKAKPPFYKREVIRHNNETLNSMYKRTFEVVSEIQTMRAELDSGADAQQLCYPHPGKDCSWRCPLASGLCSMMDDNSDWQGYLSDQWMQVDPYARYTEDSYLDRLDQEGIL